MSERKIPVWEDEYRNSSMEYELHSLVEESEKKPV